MIEVPAARYPLGGSRDLLAIAPQASWRGFPRATPEIMREVGAFAIAERLVREQDRARHPLLAALPAAADGALLATYDEAVAAARALGGGLPRWDQWEAAARGRGGLRYPWGDAIDVAALELHREDYSIDDESVMGYYAMSETIVTIRSFGAYDGTRSPFGMADLARIGHEWNDGGALGPIVRSLSDCGDMAYMMPGIRPQTFGSVFHPAPTPAFSGPMLAVYGTPNVEGLSRPLFERCAFRIVIEHPPPAATLDKRAPRPKE